MKQFIIPVEGMRCSMCEAHVNDSVRKVKGVVSVKSDHFKKNTTVVCEDDTDVNEITSAITKEGYKVEGEITSNHVKKTLFGYKVI